MISKKRHFWAIFTVFWPFFQFFTKNFQSAFLEAIQSAFLSTYRSQRILKLKIVERKRFFGRKKFWNSADFGPSRPFWNLTKIKGKKGSKISHFWPINRDFINFISTAESKNSQNWRDRFKIGRYVTFQKFFS